MGIESDVTPSVDELLAELATEFAANEPKPGEFTIEQFHDTLTAQGIDRSRETARTWLNRKVRRGELCVRQNGGKSFYRAREKEGSN